MASWASSHCRWDCVYPVPTLTQRTRIARGRYKAHRIKCVAPPLARRRGQRRQMIVKGTTSLSVCLAAAGGERARGLDLDLAPGSGCVASRSRPSLSSTFFVSAQTVRGLAEHIPVTAASLAASLCSSDCVLFCICLRLCAVLCCAGIIHCP